MNRKESILHHCKEIEEKLEIVLAGNELSFDNWGRADNYLRLNENSFLVVEIEMSQRHPEMNVLKIWPYLKNNPKKKVLLIQYLIDENSVSPNRIRLCRWLKEQMEQELSGRFLYHLFVNEIEEVEIGKMKQDLELFRTK